MKNKLIFSLAFFISMTSFCFADELSFNFSLLKSTPVLKSERVYYLQSYVLYDNFLISQYGYNGSSMNFETDYGMHSVKKISFGKDGAYKYSLRFNPRTKTYDKIYVLTGQGIFIDLYKKINGVTGRVTSAQLAKRLVDFNNLRAGLPECDKAVFVESGISSISASSELVESGTSYGASNLAGRLYVCKTDDYSPLGYDFITPPWVEGVPGYGIGEYIDVKFENSVQGIHVLNGFVDLDRTYLYYENSRVKTVEVKSTNPSFVKQYTLSDDVEFSYLEFPQTTESVRITILDVYKGTKYDDTCLSAIIPVDASNMNYEELSDHVMEMITENGTVEAVEYCKQNNLEYYDK